jgi:hypothetical protein
MTAITVALIVASGDCKSARGQFAVGRRYTAAIAERVRKETHSRVVRVLKPGAVYTMEYAFGRVDIEIDKRGRVLRVRCG